eukprot:333959-Prymnesium_polylepis.1
MRRVRAKHGCARTPSSPPLVPTCATAASPTRCRYARAPERTSQRSSYMGEMTLYVLRCRCVCFQVRTLLPSGERAAPLPLLQVPRVRLLRRASLVDAPLPVRAGRSHTLDHTIIPER